jgi:hypothetical protein
MGAISSINLLKNNIPMAQAKALARIIKEHPTLKSLCSNMGNETQLDMSGKMDGDGDAVMLAAEVIGNGALSNGCTVDIQGLSKSPGLNGMKATVLQRIKMKDASMEAYEVEIAETGELKKLKRANLAGGRVNNGAISSVNLLKNKIGVSQAEALVSMLKEHPTLKSLCGNKGNETELDMSGKMRGAGDAIMLVAEVAGSRALTSLDISNTNLTQAALGYVPYSDMTGAVHYKSHSITLLTVWFVICRFDCPC